MKLHVLGRYGPYPAPGGACSGYLVEQDRTRILMDCGSGIFSRLLEFADFDVLDAVVLSHMHSDHMADLLIMRYAKDIRSKKLPVYAPKTPEWTYQLLEKEALFDVRPVSDGMELTIGSVRIDFCAMTHPVESYAMRFRHKGGHMVYSGDTNQNDRLAGFTKGASFFLCDAAFMETELKPGQEVPHLTARQAGRIAAQAGVDCLALTHVRALGSPDGMEREAKLEHRNTIVVEEGRTYSF